MEKSQKKAIGFVLLAAVLYALNSPFSKLLLAKVPAAMMAAFLYLGAGAGLLIIGLFQRAANYPIRSAWSCSTLPRRFF